jgi:peptidoglycan/LPS O-acetylase OafA/YrhL
MPLGALALLAVHQAVERGLLGTSWPVLARTMTASIASPICMGALLACALDAAGPFARLRRVLGLRVSSPLALFVLFALVADGRAPAAAVQLAMTALVGACCMRPDHGLRAVLEAPPVRWVGTISYALYLVHVTAIGAVRRLVPSEAANAPFVFVTGLALALPLAYAIHRAVDVPLQALRARLRPRLNDDRPRAPSVRQAQPDATQESLGHPLGG